MVSDRITIDPQYMGGVPCIRRLPVAVSRILELAAQGMTREQIIDLFPELEPDDITQALLFAAQAVNGYGSTGEELKLAVAGARYLAHFGEPNEFAQWEPRDG